MSRIAMLAGALGIALATGPALHAQSPADSAALARSLAAVLTRGLAAAATSDPRDEQSRALASSGECVRVVSDSLLQPGAFRTAFEQALGGTRFVGPALQASRRRSHTVRAVVFVAASAGDSAAVLVRETYSGGRPGSRAWGGDEEYSFHRDEAAPSGWRHVGRASRYHWDGAVVGEVGEPRRPPVC